MPSTEPCSYAQPTRQLASRTDSLLFPASEMHSLSIPVCTAALFTFFFIASKFVPPRRHLQVEDRALVSGPLDPLAASKRNALRKEIKERRRELLPSYTAKLSHQDPSAYLENDVNLAAAGTDLDLMGCKHLRHVQNLQFLGSGYTKAVLKGALPRGLLIALKSVNHQGTDMRRCVEDFGDVEGCSELVSYKLIKEIMLLQRLQHPNIIKLHGHCQGNKWGSGITAALELGSPLQMIQLLQSPWEERFRMCLSLVRLLHYLSVSPLGSVALLDFQPRQFVTVAGELKLTDLDDATAGDQDCSTDTDCTLTFPQNNFTVPCTKGGTCQGLNEKRNLYNAYRYFFTYLLPHRAPPTLQPLVDKIMNSTRGLSSGINEILEAFEEILQLYMSGQYLKNLSPSLLRDYTAVKGMRVAGSVDYRCWPSYNQQGCVLSVHSAREAAHICSSHAQCTSFTISSQRTWAGRFLASFRSGFRDLIPDVNSALYVKRGGSSRAAAQRKERGSEVGGAGAGMSEVN